MAQTIVRLVLMIFLSALFLMLALYSTTFKARAKRSFMVYEIIAISLIIGDHNLILGVIEFIVFQIIIIFSTIGCLYSYAEIEINEKKAAEKDCTALVKIPLKKQTAEVDQKTINSIQDLALCIFIACLAVLIFIRPPLLFPFYGRNAAAFISGILITIFTFYTSLKGGDSRRAIETNDTGWETSLVFVSIITILAYGFIQLIAFFVYLDADEKAQQNNIIQDSIPASYGKMLPINHIYDYEDQIPYDIKDIDVTDNLYLIRTDTDTDRYYYCLYGFDKIQKTIDNRDTEIYIHIVEKDMEPRVDIYNVFYLNPRGEEDIAKNIYHFYLKEEQIITLLPY